MHSKPPFLVITWLALAGLLSAHSAWAQCGVERWSVKTGTDADAGLVNLSAVTAATIPYLASLATPSSLPSNNRIQPTEVTVFQLTCTLVEFKLENDSDYHLVLSDGAGNTMIAEIPSPGCVGAGSPFSGAISAARQTFDASYTATGTMKTVNVPVQVSGVGFFDFIHGQTGVAPNGIELHPVLNIAFNPSQSPDFSLSASPASISVQQGASGTVNVSTAAAGGFNSAVTLSASGLPSGASASFSPASIAAPGSGSSTLAISAGTSTPTASSPVTVTASGGGKSHSASVALTITGPAPAGGVTDGGFESGLTGWTAGSGSGTVAPVASTGKKHSGSYSAYLAGSGGGSATNCILYQNVTVPAGGGTLSFWYYPISPDTITYDWQEVDICNTSGTVLANVMKVCSNTQAWTQATYSLAAYANQTIQLRFTVHDDGYSGDQTNMYVDDVAVTAPASAYSISGTITSGGTGLSGVTVTAGTASATTSSTGAYTISGLANGTYTVAPSLSGYTFTPASASETVNGADITGVNFTATANPPSTYSISGTITSGGSGLSGVTVTAGSASATTNSSGAYTVSGLANGTYTVTPTLSGYTFSPASASETVSGANITGVNFTAAASGGTGLTNGGFESGLTGWTAGTGSGTVAPVASTGKKHSGSYSAYLAGSGGGSATNCILYQNVTVPAGGGTLSFWYYPISPDTITYDWQEVDICNTSGTVLANVMKVCSNAQAWTNKTFSLASYAGQTIQIRFTDHDDGYSGDQTNMYVDDVTITAPAATYTVSGTITYNGSGLSGVTVTAGSASATTNSSGAYTISGLANGTYTVTPGLAGYTFTPASASETVNGANITGVNFTAAVASGPATLFSDGFESTTGWGSVSVSGSTASWSQAASGSYPSASPHGGSYLADFNSYSANAGDTARIYRTSGFAVAGTYTTVTLTFWMYHDTGYSSYNDQVQVQVSTNGTTWTNVGSPVSRYNGSTGWAQATVDLSAYKGQTVYLGFLGISAYGNDEYLDDVSVVAQ